MLKLGQDKMKDTSLGFEGLCENFGGVCGCSTEFEHLQKDQRGLGARLDTLMHLDKTKYTNVGSGSMAG